MRRVLSLTGLCVMALVASAAQAQPSVSFFRELPDLDVVGFSPGAVVTADFNDDQKIDLAVANSDSDDVSILLGNGDGTFLDTGVTFLVDSNLCNSCTSTTPPTNACSPVAIAIGDFNHDGAPDIVTANDIGNSVSVLINCFKNPAACGGSNFAPGVLTCTGMSPEGVVVGDFDGDPNPDAATADSFGTGVGPNGTVTVLKGVGDGSFTVAQTYDVGSEPIGLAAGFLHGDANPLDLVVANSSGGPNASGTIQVLKGLGGEMFEPQPEIELDCGAQAGSPCSPFAVAVAKLDNDANLDLAIANFDGSNVSILLGNGDLTFRPGGNPSVGISPAAIVTDDFNGDGKTDIATSNSFGDNVSVLLGVGDGTFMESADFLVGTSPFGIAAGKFNNDKFVDLVSANQDDDTVSILFNTTGCFGDCNFDGEVTVDELLTMASIGLGTAPLAECPAVDVNQDMRITVNEIVGATNTTIAGCTK